MYNCKCKISSTSGKGSNVKNPTSCDTTNVIIVRTKWNMVIAENLEEEH